MARNASQPQAGAQIQRALALSQQGRFDEAERICDSIFGKLRSAIGTV